MILHNHIFELHTWAMLITTPIALAIGIHLLARYKLPSAFYLGLMEIAIGVWSFFAFWESAAQTVPLKIFWSKMAYLGTPTSPLFFFFFVLAYTRNEKFLTLKNNVLLSVIPVLAIFLAFTNEWHHLIWTDVEINPSTNIGFYHHGFFFYIYLGYVYILLMTGMYFLFQAVRQLARDYKTQIYVLMSGLCLPIVANIIYVFDINPLHGFDWTPVSFMLSGLLLAWGLYYYKLFEIIPIARTQLIDSMDDGVLVLDMYKRIADCNPAMQRISQMAKPCHGSPLIELPELMQEILNRIMNEKLQTFETSLMLSGEKHYFDIHYTQMDSTMDALIGHLFIFRDITQILKLRKFSNHLIYSQEYEKAAVAREIHDHLGQTLVALKMDLNWIWAKIENVQPELSEHILEMDNHFSNMVHKVQEIIGDLHPSLLDDLGLSETVDWYIHEFEQKTGIRCVSNIAEHTLPPGDLAIKMYRAIEELLIKVIKHYSLSFLRISLKKENNYIVFIVEFNCSDFPKVPGSDFSGLAGIQERLVGIHGSLDISNFDGVATKIILTVPLLGEKVYD